MLYLTDIKEIASGNEALGDFSVYITDGVLIQMMFVSL